MIPALREEALQAYRAGAYQRAAILADYALEAFPSMPRDDRVFFLRVLGAALAQEPTTHGLAVGTLKEALACAENNPELQAPVLVQLQAAAVRVLDPVQAKRWLNRFLRLAARHPIPGVLRWTGRAWLDAGIIRFRTGHVPEAVAAYERALTFFESHPEVEDEPGRSQELAGMACINLAHAHLCLGHPAVAQQLTTKASALLQHQSERFAPFIANLDALYHLASGELDAAEEKVFRALETLPTTPHTRAELYMTAAHIAQRRGDTAGVERLLDLAHSEAKIAGHSGIMHEVFNFWFTNGKKGVVGC